MKSLLYNIVRFAFVLLIVVPLVYIFTAAFVEEGALRDGLRQFTGVTYRLLARSGLIALIVAFFSTLIGTVLGFLLYKTRLVLRGFFKVALLIPLFISPYILAVAWKDFFFLLSGNTGVVSSYMGMILVLTTVFTPLSMLVIGSALANIHAAVEESGLMITSPRTVFLKITIPLIKPALITSFILVFIFSVSEFSVPAFFGVNVFTTEIFTQFAAFYNHSLAILQSTLLVVICVMLLFAERKYIAEAPFLSVGSRGTRYKRYVLRRRGWGIAMLLFWLVISVMVPFVILSIQSFQGGGAAFVEALRLLSPTFLNSIGLALLGALVTVIVGFSFAYRPEGGKGDFFGWLLLIVFAIPSTVLGISLIKFYNHPALNFVYSSYIIILIGYVGKFSFLASKLIENAIGQLPKSLDEAAMIQGVSHFARVRKLLIPMILPSVFAAFTISFIFNLGELGVTIMLYPPGTEIMPIKVFTIMANAPQSLTSAMTLIVFTLTLVLILFFYGAMRPLLRKYRFSND